MITRRTFVTGTSALFAGTLLSACSGTRNDTGASSSQAASEPSPASPATSSAGSASASTAAPAASAPSSASPGAAAESVAVVYFSATGTTRAVAEKLAARLGVEAREIVPAEAYTADDLDYNTEGTRATVEARDASARPALAGVPDVSGADTVYLGYPIWWGAAAAPARTFAESADLAGKTVVPFCTSGSSPIEPASLEAIAGSGEWLEGRRFAAGADVVYLGFPIWWYTAPHIVNSFLEAYDFSGKTVVVWATSGGSGLGHTVSDLAASAPGANLVEGGMANGGNVGPIAAKA